MLSKVVLWLLMMVIHPMMMMKQDDNDAKDAEESVLDPTEYMDQKHWEAV